MKKCLKDCLIVSAISIIIAIVIFLLLNFEILAFNENINVFLLLSVIVSIYVLTKLLKVKKIVEIRDSYCYCGHLSAIGGAGIFLIPFILILFITTNGVLYNLILALYFLFLVLFIGGYICLLYEINECHNNCYEDCNKREDKDNYEDYGVNRNREYAYKERRR